jgi:hypothetical protein
MNKKTQIILFGGNKQRRIEVTDVIHSIRDDIKVYGALSEEEGMQLLELIKDIDIVLIGGRYTIAQRKRICDYILEFIPDTKITQPGFEYPYSNENIKQHITNLIN